MSKITNLIGTTWRFGSDVSYDAIPAEYGFFKVICDGFVSGYENGNHVTAPANSVNFLIGYYGLVGDDVPSIPTAGVASVYMEIANNGTYGLVPLGTRMTQIFGDGSYYEFTITGGDDIANPLFIDFINTYGTLVSGGEPPTAEGVKSKLQSLLTASNAKTGKSDANLTDAVKTLLDGFGSGEGIFAEEENEHGTTVVLGADLQEKTIDITANGTVEVTPDEGYALKKVTANVDVKGVDKIRKWIELNGNSAQYMFHPYNGESVDELFEGSDTSNLTDANYMFYKCSKLTSVPLFNTSNVKKMLSMFEYCTKLTSVPLFDTSNVENMSAMFYICTSLISVPPFNTRKLTNMSSLFYNCSSLASVPALDIRSVTTAMNPFYGCSALTECWVRNIKYPLTVGSGTSYGHLLTLESLLHLCKECRNVNASRRLTMGTANLEKLEGIYVKLIDITDDMRAEDDLIDEKYPFVQCESTDEGAMTIQDYMATKMWSLA